MLSENKIKLRFDELIAEFSKAFPNIEPPALEWWRLWMEKHPLFAISESIQTLAQHPLKSQFTTESCGRAISAMLRERALNRAFAPAPVKAAKP